MKLQTMHLSPAEAASKKDQVVSVYRAVYSVSPYEEDETQIERFSTSWTSRTRMPGFIFSGVVAEKNELVGLAYGWRSVPGDSWNEKLTEQLGLESRKWLEDCFEFVDLAVDPRYQGQGLGKELLTSLFEKVTQRTAILLTHQSVTTASRMYLKQGWIEVKRDFEVSPGKLYQIMGKELRKS